MEPMKQKLAPRHTEQTFGCPGEEDWGGMVREVGINKCKLLYIEWINKMNVYIFYSFFPFKGCEVRSRT